MENSKRGQQQKLSEEIAALHKKVIESGVRATKTQFTGRDIWQQMEG